MADVEISKIQETPKQPDFKAEPKKRVAPDTKSAAAPTKPADEPKQTKPKVEGIVKTTWQKSPEVQDIIETLSGENSKISITMDKETHLIVIEVFNAETGQLIRKIPTERRGTGAEPEDSDLTGLSVDFTA